MGGRVIKKDWKAYTAAASLANRTVLHTEKCGAQVLELLDNTALYGIELNRKNTNTS